MSKHEAFPQLSGIRLIVMDVDGTLTDGSLYYSKHGEELKRFNVRDGMGIVLLRKSGIKTALLTSETSPIVTARGEKLGIDHVFLGSHNKTESLRALAEKSGVTLDEVLFVGDDVNDLHGLRTAGFSACPADAVDVIKQNVDYICECMGGHGVIRELAEMILGAQAKPVTLDENW